MSKLDELDKQFDEKFIIPKGHFSGDGWENVEGKQFWGKYSQDGGVSIKSFARKYYELGKLEEREALKITENTSDGYHTFKELYEFRKVYNAALFNEWAAQGKYGVHKSKKHHDGEDCFGGGWFIVSATLPTGQISNHYELKEWDLFKCEEKPLAEKWDGHTPNDVIKRLTNLNKNV